MQSVGSLQWMLAYFKITKTNGINHDHCILRTLDCGARTAPETLPVTTFDTQTSEVVLGAWSCRWDIHNTPAFFETKRFAWIILI